MDADRDADMDKRKKNGMENDRTEPRMDQQPSDAGAAWTGHMTGRPTGAKAKAANRRMFAALLRGAMFRRRSRALMAVVASFIGAATLFCLVLVCMAVPQQMTEEMRSYGANLVLTASGSDGSGIPEESVEKIVADVDAAGTEKHAEYRYETVRVHAASYVLAGMDSEDTKAIDGHWTVEGDWPAAGDTRGLMVGSDIADLMDLSVGSTLKVSARGDDSSSQEDSRDAGTGASSKARQRGQEGRTSTDILSSDGESFRVCGIIDTGGEEDSMIYADVALVESLTGTTRGPDAIEFSSSTSDDGLTQLVDTLNSRRDDYGAKAQKVTRISASNERIVSMLNVLFWVVSVVVLVLTLIGVATTVTSIVSQRRNEIALRKALGASRRSLSREFYAESALYGFAGGVLGVIVGYWVAKTLTENVFERSPGFNWALCLLSLIVSVVVSVCASIAPVRRAARIDPAVVLREE